jgi:hypothetical protein
MKQIILSFSVLALIVSATACKKKNNTPVSSANVMFVHGCAAGATTVNLDAIANGASVSGATNLSFLHNSGYQSVSGGNVALIFKATGLSNLTNANETLVANSHYTAFAGGSITAPVFVFATDDLTAPTAGYAKVRFVNLCPDGLRTACYIGSNKVDSGVAYEAVTPYFNVAVATGKVSMIDEVVLTNSATIPAQVISEGKIYTFMMTGTVSGNGSSILTLTAINNN